MRFKGLNTAALVLVAFFGSNLALAKGGKAAAGKAAKECTDKHGTWDKKKKKCEPAKDEAAGATTPAPAEESAEPAPAPAE